MRPLALLLLALLVAGCSSGTNLPEDRAKAARERVKQAEQTGVPK